MTSMHEPQREGMPLGGSAFPPIADYGFLSDCETTALVAPSGNVEWLCLPRIDIAERVRRDPRPRRRRLPARPRRREVPAARRYLPGTMVLETSWEDATAAGSSCATCCSSGRGTTSTSGRTPTAARPPTTTPIHVLLRTVRCVNGEVQIVLDCEPVFDYGRSTATWDVPGRGYHEASATADGEDLELRLTTDMQPRLRGAGGRRRARC